MSAHKETPTRFGEVAATLWQHRYRPIRLKPDTKIAYLRGWNNRNETQWTQNALTRQIQASGDDACGIAVHKELCVLDIDILDTAVNHEVVGLANELLGLTSLVRIGNAPKQVQVRRSDGTTRSRKAHPLEVFSGSGQVAVFGFHQKAGRPYQWPEQSLLDVNATDPSIPIVSGAQVDAFMVAAEPILRELRAEMAAKRGHRLSRSGRVGSWPARWKELAAMGPTRAALTIAQEAEAIGSGRHDAFFYMVNQWVREGKSPEELIYLLERAAPALMAHIDKGDDYSGRVVGFALDNR